MKNIKYLFVMIFAVALSVSCSSDDDSTSDPSTNALIGSWETVDVQEGIEYDFTITFNPNNTGTSIMTSTVDGFTKTETNAFTWSTDGNKITINNNVGTYSISGSTLTMTSEGKDLIFTKQ